MFLWSSRRQDFHRYRLLFVDVSDVPGLGREGFDIKSSQDSSQTPSIRAKLTEKKEIERGGGGRGGGL